MLQETGISRRHWLQQTACGFGALALHTMAQGKEARSSMLPEIKPRAKRVIFLFMQGGPSQHDLFDPKEYIRKKHGQPIVSPLSKNILQVGTERFLALGATYPDRKSTRLNSSHVSESRMPSSA